jgi:RNA polymerase sigma-70 factor (ECF subfamily)
MASPGRTGSADIASVATTDAALETLVADHYERLLRLARLICRDASDAADAVQAGLEQGWRRRADLRSDAAARAWLDRIVVREAIRVARSRRTWWARLLHSDERAAWIEPSDIRATVGVERAALRAALAELSPEQRAVVGLHLHAGYSVAETAILVGAPEETVRSRLRLARQRLRRALEVAER